MGLQGLHPGGGGKMISSKCLDCSVFREQKEQDLIDKDVLLVAKIFQQCKRETRKSGQVVINFNPQGNINLNQIQWVGKIPLGRTSMGF
jgi:hypothetical protein